jgi:flagellar basal-body rod protein FlgB
MRSPPGSALPAGGNGLPPVIGLQPSPRRAASTASQIAGRRRACRSRGIAIAPACATIETIGWREARMHSVLDNYLGIHAQALALEAQRTDVLAANLANVDTPNYKARDMDFKAALAAASGQSDASTLTLTTTNGADLTNAGTPAAADGGAATSAADPTYLKYRVPLAPALDGNTVDEQLEQSAFAENSVRYQASLAFLNIKLRDLLTAISSS